MTDLLYQSYVPANLPRIFQIVGLFFIPMKDTSQ